MNSTIAAPPSARAPRRLPSLAWWPAGLLVLAIPAFFPTYFGRFPAFAGTSGAVHFHLATMVAWLALGIAQPILIRRRQVALHRALGASIYVLLPVIALGFVLVLRDGQLRHKEPELILATAFDAGMFFLLAGLGLYFRRRREYHAAFMMLSFLPFLNPTLGRLIAPGAGVPVELVAMIVLLVRARRRQRAALPYAVALVAFLAATALLGVVMGAFPGAAESLWRLLVT